MKEMNGIKVIGIDHGYGNMKTAGHVFKTGITGYDRQPTFTKDMLVYEDRYYLIGEGHKEFIGDKAHDQDFFLLSLAGIAMELRDEGLTEAEIVLAVGLPLTWVSTQKEEFASYFPREEPIAFTWNRVEYTVRITGVRVYPQGFAAIAPITATMKGMSVTADIGNGTMNTLFLTNGRPMTGKMFTEKFGVNQCVLAVKEAFMRETQRELPDFIIDEVLREGKADIPAADLRIIRETAQDYVFEIFRRLRDHGYDADTMGLYVTGGGVSLVKHFAKVNPKRVKLIEDICANAKGYEYMAETQIRSGR